MLLGFKKYIPKGPVREVLYVLLATLPVFIFVFKFSVLNRNGVFLGEDWGYFAQQYEAARQSILHYHQFPWWNPWMNGGQPLFANPQFGLFSIQMPFVLIFGTVVGLHISILAYYLLGFWGMYRLLQRLGSTSRLLTLLLSYIWIFSSFAAWHLGGGHLTFAIYLLSPWAFLTVLNIHKKRGWLWFGLVASLLILNSIHYLTIETLLICGFIGTVQVTRRFLKQKDQNVKSLWPLLKPYAFAAVVILVLCSVRLVYTLDFIRDYPRFEALDPPVSLRLLIAAFTFRRPTDPTLFKGIYGWSEYANYLGLFTLILFFYLLLRRLEKVKSIRLTEWFLLGAICLSLLLAVGAFSPLSPYAVIHHFPIFEQMRVPSRFVCWVGLGVILFLIKLPRKPLFYALLIFSALDVFAASYPILNYAQKPYVVQINTEQPFQQYEFYDTDPSLGHIGILSLQNFRLLRATQQNSGEVYGYEPILNVGEYYFLPGTNRCGIKQSCEFVLTGNATVAYWSPHKISLQRTGEGDIKLNMNPGKVWKVNGTYPFTNDRVLELKEDFIITDSSQNIDVTYSPVL